MNFFELAAHADKDVREIAAEAFGMPASEVVSVEDFDGDPMVTTHDGVRTVVVSEDRPDGAGRHGLLLFARPDGRTDPEAPLYATPLYTPRSNDVDAPAAPSPRKKATSGK